MLQPERIVGNGVDFVRGLAHPAFAPAIDDTVLLRPRGDIRERNFENDRVDVLARLRILARINETIIAVLVLFIYNLGRRGAAAPYGSEFPLVLGILGSVVAFATAAFYSFPLSITANGLMLWAMLAVGYRILTFSEAAG